MVKKIIMTMALLSIAGCTPIAPANDYKLTAGDACHAPLRPMQYADQGAISKYQVQRQKFMDCVHNEDPSSPSYQSDLAQSLAMVGDDQTQGVNIIQRYR